ncbi:calcium-binding protein [Moorena sp. SIO4G3]|uniref:calcium-binding protein n=1 Tax=Moorena sp. SIO4G3 TaxID=2607821 RepID=UPI00142A2F87|nr:calcium-binding protein [Moorena sp. SIO4G3]NEO81525.1 calcium-binding protein [Moorena sp. SIO4G3]
MREREHGNGGGQIANLNLCNLKGEKTMALIQGTELNNSLVGTPANDTIVSFGGDDTIDATQGGNDLILAESGNDTVTGGSGNDTVTGGDDNDLIEGNGGDDQLTGGRGSDTIRGGSGNDDIFGGSGNDTLRGGRGNDSVSGFDGDDFLSGGGGDDSLNGGNDNDRVVGLSGNDFLEGGAGNDTLDGGTGNDSLFGDRQFSSSGNNVPLNDYLVGGTGNDFLAGGNSIDSFLNQGLDTLIGGAIGVNSGAGEIDTLQGSISSQDTFVLGLAPDPANGLSQDEILYDNQGTQDYAFITDFGTARASSGPDRIQLVGELDDYVFGASPFTNPTNDFDGDVSQLAISLDSNGNGNFDSTDELIAIVDGISPIGQDVLSNPSSLFTFV